MRVVDAIVDVNYLDSPPRHPHHPGRVDVHRRRVIVGRVQVPSVFPTAKRYVSLVLQSENRLHELCTRSGRSRNLTHVQLCTLILTVGLTSHRHDGRPCSASASASVWWPPLRQRRWRCLCPFPLHRPLWSTIELAWSDRPS